MAIWTLWYNSPAQVAARQEEAQRAEQVRREQERRWHENQERQSQEDINRKYQEEERRRQEKERRRQEEEMRRRCYKMDNGQVFCCPSGQLVGRNGVPYRNNRGNIVIRWVPFCHY